MTDDLDQFDGLRYEAAFHESGHCVAGYLLGRQIDRAELEPAVDRRPGAEPASCVWFAPSEITNVHEAEDHVVVFLAGECTPRVAWSKGLLVGERRPKRRPSKPLTVDEILLIPNGASEAESAAYYGMEDVQEEHDEREARRLVDAWTSSPLEAAALMAWCRARTASFVATERFQALAGTIAAVLLDRGEISGELAAHLLERADRVHEAGARASEEGGSS